MTEALIAEIGRAQVVRDGREERRPELVRRGDGAGRLGLGLELAEVDGRLELAGEGVEHALVLAANRRAGEREHVLGVELDRRGARLRASPGRGLRSPPRSASRSSWRWRTAAPSSPSTRRRPSSTAETVEEPASRASASASARARAPSACAAGGERDEARDDRADGEEDEEREHVLALGDRERVVGLDEEPVDEQEAADRGREPGPEPADGGDATTRSRKRSITLGSSS